MARRAREILGSDALRKYLLDSKVDRSLQNNKSFLEVKQWLMDPLSLCKLAFFEFVASLVEPFLKLYQTVKPMLPFLAMDLKELITELTLLLKESAVEEAKDILCIDLEKNERDEDYRQLGSTTFRLVQKVGDKATPSQRLHFRKEVKSILKRLVIHLREKSPVCRELVRDMKCIQPNYLAENCHDAEACFHRVCEELVIKNQLPEDDVDKAIYQFRHFSADSSNQKKLSDFKKSEYRLDELYFTLVPEDHTALLDVLKKLLILSHGQAAVERGFSLNKQVTLRMIYWFHLYWKSLTSFVLFVFLKVLFLCVCVLHVYACTQALIIPTCITLLYILRKYD